MEVFLSTLSIWSAIPLAAPWNCPELRMLMSPTSKQTQFLGLDNPLFSRSQPVGLVPPIWLSGIPGSRIDDPNVTRNAWRISAAWGNGSKIDGNLIARKVGRNLDTSDVLRSGFS